MTIVLISLLDFESFPIRQMHAFLEREGIDVKSVFLKSTGYAFPSEKEVEILIDYLNSINPSLIGISLRSRYFVLAKQITLAIKKNINVPVVWGGIHPTIAPDKCLEYADIICRGEGEFALKELAEKIEKGEDYKDILNLWVKKEGKIFKNGIRPLVENLDIIPFTDFTDSNKVYIEENKIAFHLNDIKSTKVEFPFTYPIMTSRGCLFNCTYCGNSYLRKMYLNLGKYTRRRSVNNVITELKLAKKNFPYLNAITFGDDVFTFDYNWLKSFAKEYKEHINLPFFTMFNPSAVEERSVKLLKEIGLTNVQMGIQSGSERIRTQYYSRFNSNNQIRDALKIFKKYKFTASCDLILGNVFETDEDRNETLELLLSLPKPYILHCFYMNYFPNYQFTNMALENGLISENQITDNLPYEKQSCGKQFDENRPIDFIFLEAVYKLASFKYFPCTLTRRVGNSQFARKNPRPFIFAVKFLLYLRNANRFINFSLKNYSNPKMVYSKIKQKLTRGAPILS